MRRSSRSDLSKDLDLKRPRIVASLGRNALKDVNSLEGAEVVELRLDLFEDHVEDPLDVARRIRDSTSLPIIVTNRMNSEGGRFLGGEQERIQILMRCSDCADMIDIEMRAPLLHEVLRIAEKPVIISYHDFSGMPKSGEMRAILEKIKGAGADIAKIAVTPSNLKDNLEILSFLLEADMPLCMIAMGEVGRHIRAVAPIYGSVLTYGYVSDATAPGQMSVRDLRKSLRLLDPSFGKADP